LKQLADAALRCVNDAQLRRHFPGELTMTTRESVAADAAATNTHALPLVAFGLDDRRLPQAGRFTAEEATAARLSARLMGLSVLPIATDAHRELASLVKPGDVMAGSRRFAPLIGLDVYEYLKAEAASHGEAEPQIPALDRPRNWKDIAAGHVIVAQEPEADDHSWFEALVINAADESLAVRWLDDPRGPAVPLQRRSVALKHHGR
jgi:hypothetical protein